GLGQQPADVQVAAALDGETDSRVDRRKRAGDLVVVVQNRLLGVDVSGRAKLFGNLAGLHTLAVQLTVLIEELIHPNPRLRHQTHSQTQTVIYTRYAASGRIARQGHKAPAADERRFPGTSPSSQLGLSSLPQVERLVL